MESHEDIKRKLFSSIKDTKYTLVDNVALYVIKTSSNYIKGPSNPILKTKTDSL